MEYTEVRIHKPEAVQAKTIPALSARKDRQIPSAISIRQTIGSSPVNTRGIMEKTHTALISAAKIVTASLRLAVTLSPITRITPAAAMEMNTAIAGRSARIVSVILSPP